MSKSSDKSKPAKQRRDKAGQPAFYETPEELQDKIDEYFQGGYRMRTIITKDGDKIEVPAITISDLVIFLGFCDRSSFYNYEEREKFSYTIKKARTFIEREYEELLQKGLGAGAIFALKNFGWVDKTLVDLGGQKANPFQAQEVEAMTVEEQLRVLNEKLHRGKTK